MDDDRIVRVFADAAEEVLGRPLEAVHLDSDIADLGIDSLGLMEIVERLEERLGVCLVDDELVGVSSLRSFVDLVRRAEP